MNRKFATLNISSTFWQFLEADVGLSLLSGRNLQIAGWSDWFSCPHTIHGSGIFTCNDWLIFMVHVGKYTIHGWYGVNASLNHTLSMLASLHTMTSSEGYLDVLCPFFNWGTCLIHFVSNFWLFQAECLVFSFVWASAASVFQGCFQATCPGWPSWGMGEMSN